MALIPYVMYYGSAIHELSRYAVYVIEQLLSFGPVWIEENRQKLNSVGNTDVQIAYMQ